MPPHTWVRRSARRFGTLTVIVAALVALSACGQRETLLAVNAQATTRTTPDLAVVTLSVLARGPNARAAQEAQSVRMNGVLRVAHSAGAQDGDIQTVGFSLEPQYVQSRGQAPRLTGYVSRNTVSIRLRNLDAVSGLIDVTVAEGANELQGIQFTYQDQEASREAARARALRTARQRAERYAQAADMHVAGIRSIVEPGSTFAPAEADRYAFPPRLVAVEQATSNASAVAPGQLDNEARVTVVFELR